MQDRLLRATSRLTDNTSSTVYRSVSFEELIDPRLWYDNPHLQRNHAFPQLPTSPRWGFRMGRRQQGAYPWLWRHRHTGGWPEEETPDDHPHTRMAFYIRRHKFNTWTERRSVIGDVMRWHLRLGHPGPQALEHLVNAYKGVRIKGLKTVECEACVTQGKAPDPTRT
jgi:hypothetical protein